MKRNQPACGGLANTEIATKIQPSPLCLARQKNDFPQRYLQWRRPVQSFGRPRQGCDNRFRIHNRERQHHREILHAAPLTPRMKCGMELRPR